MKERTFTSIGVVGFAPTKKDRDVTGWLIGLALCPHMHSVEDLPVRPSPRPPLLPFSYTPNHEALLLSSFIFTPAFNPSLFRLPLLPRGVPSSIGEGKREAVCLHFWFVKLHTLLGSNGRKSVAPRPRGL